MFRIEAIGNLGGDAEIKNDNGRQYVQFSVADSRKYKKDDGTEQEVTNWISCFYRAVDSEVVKYLKKGTRVFVRGNGDLRLFSSAKDRMMKAGASINVTEIELVGGAAEPVPRELALSTGQLVPVNKLYWVDTSALNEKPTVMYDRKGNPFTLDANGFVLGMVQQPAEPATASDGTQDAGLNNLQQPAEPATASDGAQTAKQKDRRRANNVQTVKLVNPDGSETEIY